MRCMEAERLTKLATDFLHRHYEIALNIPIMRNNRLRTTQGRYVTKRDNTPLRMEISGQTLDYGTDDAILGIIKHECIHYALHQLKQPYKDGTALFESELRKHNAPSTRTMLIGKLYTFTCNQCGTIGETRRKQLMKTPEKYRTTCCQAKLTWTGERIYDGSGVAKING